MMIGCYRLFTMAIAYPGLDPVFFFHLHMLRNKQLASLYLIGHLAELLLSRIISDLHNSI